MTTTLGEHLEYISDSRRLGQFREALAAAIRPGDTIADLGCGFGVLGLLCLEAGAAHVWGIDSSDAIEIARETMDRAGLADRYTCIRDHTSRAVLPEPVDVLICDHVGFFGVDYGIIDMIGDARRRLLKPGGRIIPGRISLILAGVGSHSARGEAEGWSAPAIPAQYRWLRSFGVNTKHARELDPGEIATAPVALGTIDLAADNPDLLSFTASLKADRDVRLDGLAGWFDCELVPGVRMTNSPLAEAPIDRSQAFLPLDQPIEMTAGKTIEVGLSIRHDSGLISWTVWDHRTGRRQKHSTWNGRILSESELTRNPDRPLRLSRDGSARRIVSGYVDGARTAAEIEAAVLRDHPGLLPSAQEIRCFVRSELGRNTQ